jgi:KUP system potassium uptake protein
MSEHYSSSKKPPLATLVFGALGVVYGDIGTSPLYAIKECFSGSHALPIDSEHVLGVLSLIFWAIMIVVSLKYVTFILRADNKGEGGSLALLALVSRITGNSRISAWIVVLGIFAAALFYGDSIITPAISVLSAVEGLEVVTPALKEWVMPISLTILVGLFVIQRHGTALLGRLFGPVMCLWFGTLAVLGLIEIAANPQVLAAIDPRHGFNFMQSEGWKGYLVLGSVVLVLTGAEALYADMGHFGAKPIRVAWFLLVLPALLLNYFGQGALLLTDPGAIENPFYRLAPEWGLLPLVVLSTMATIIASQAVISGAYSVTRQAIQLGFLPRMEIVHTSDQEIGQIYIPFVNWSLLGAIILLVVNFKASSNLAIAYGVAVTGTMLITTIQISVVMLLQWRWSQSKMAFFSFLFLTIDLAFFSANALKIAQGGWFPLTIGFVIFSVLTTWREGRKLLGEKLESGAMPVDLFFKSISSRIRRVAGTAIFMTGRAEGVPHALLHNIKHNMALHERNFFLTVVVEEIPHVSADRRMTVEALGNDFFRIVINYGFMDEPDIPKTLLGARENELRLNLMETSFFLGRETIVISSQLSMPFWRKLLFAWMSRNAASAMNFYRLPPNRVVELGSQVEI